MNHVSNKSTVMSQVHICHVTNVQITPNEPPSMYVLSQMEETCLNESCHVINQQSCHKCTFVHSTVMSQMHIVQCTFVHKSTVMSQMHICRVTNGGVMSQMEESCHNESCLE